MTRSTTANMVMGFDFGMKRIGVAVGQRVTGTATAVTVLKAKDGIPNWQAISALLKEWSPDELVVGNPLNMDGTDSEMTHLSKKFANRLHGRFGLTCHHIDERLTTFEARDADSEGDVDDIAACLIVESYFRTG